MLIAAQPTRGLDVGAIEYVHRRLVAERDAGRAVLLVSLELDEVLSLSDRILVIFEGEIVGEYGPDVTEEELGHRDDRRAPEGAGGGVSEGPLDPRDEERLEEQEEQLLEQPEGVHGGDYAPSVAARMAVMQRAGGVVMPIVTTLFAFAMAMIVIAATGPQPVQGVQGDLRRHRAELALPLGDGRRPRRRRVQPPADADPDDRR